MQHAEDPQSEGDPAEPSHLRSFPRKVVTRSNSLTPIITRRASINNKRTAFKERATSLKEPLSPGVTLGYSARPPIREVQVLGHPQQTFLNNTSEVEQGPLFKATMPTKEHLVTKGGGATSHHASASTSHHATCKTWATCKKWCRKQRRCLVWAVLTLAVAIAAILWYHHVKHAQEMARKKSKRWWF